MKTDKFLKLCKIVVILAVALVILLWLLSSCEFGRNYLDELTIQSPSGKFTLIIKEWETIGGAGAKIYCTKDGRNSKKLGEIITDDCVLPFHDGNYTLEWKEDTVVIRYFSGRAGQHTGDPNTWETVRYDLP